MLRLHTSWKALFLCLSQSHNQYAYLSSDRCSAKRIIEGHTFGTQYVPRLRLLFGCVFYLRHTRFVDGDACVPKD